MTKVLGIYGLAMGVGIGVVALLGVAGYAPAPLYCGFISGGLCFATLTFFRKTLAV